MGEVLFVDLDCCTYGWAADGAHSYPGGHSCGREAWHEGRHRCECGATSSALWTPEEEAKVNG